MRRCVCVSVCVQVPTELRCRGSSVAGVADDCVTVNHLTQMQELDVGPLGEQS